MKNFSMRLSTLLSLSVLLCAFAVLCGWIVGSVRLVQIMPGLAPMQFNTAICFLLLSFPIFSSRSLAHSHLSKISIVLCFLVSSTALIEHLLGSNIGIDTLFFEPEITDRTLYPGRMSISTALSFMFGSLGFLGVTQSSSENEKFLWVVVTLAALSVSSAAFIEYLFSLNPQHGHSALLGMAFHTALCHVMLALSILLLSPVGLEEFSVEQRVTSVLFPLMICIGLSIFAWDGVLGLYLKLQKESLYSDSQVRAELVKNEIDMTENVLRAVRLFYLGSTEVSEDEFQTFVKPLTDRSESLLAIDWTPRTIHQDRELLETQFQREKSQSFQQLDEDRKLTYRKEAQLYFPVSYSYPNIENGKAFGFDHYSDPLRTIAMDRAASTNDLAVTIPFSLFRLAGRYDTPTDVLLILPFIRDKSSAKIYNARDPRVEGFIFGVVRSAKILEKLFKGFEDIGLNASLYYIGEDEERILTHSKFSKYHVKSDKDLSSLESLAHEEQFVIGDSRWELRFIPTSYFLKNQITILPSLLLVFFLFSSFLLSLYLFIIQQAKARALESKQKLAQTNEALKEREEWFAQLSRTSTVGIFRTDGEGTCVYVNEAWCKLTGLSFEQAIGDGWAAAIHPDDREEVFRVWKETAGEGEPFRHQFRFLHPSGEVRWTIAASKPVFDSERKIIGHVGTNFDLTEQIRAEQEIRDLSAMQSAIIDNAGYSIISTTPHGVITSFNPTAEDMLGYRAEEMIGICTPAVFHDGEEIAAKAKVLTEALGREIEPGFEVFTEAAKSGVEAIAEWTYIRKDGSRFLVLLNVTPITNPEGDITGYIGTAADITERARLRGELEENLERLAVAKQAAESAAEAKAAFLANMSHEIRTPLTTVTGYAEQLLDQSLTDKQREEFTNTIVQNSEHLLELINDILDFSKLEAGMIIAHRGESQLFDLVETVESGFKKQAEERGVEFYVDYDFPLPEKFETDALRLKQILINLIGNAIKFTKKGEVRLVVGFDKESNQLVFAVKDTGIGLKQEQIPKLFKDFSQADESTTKKFGGTGLGLSLSKRFVEMLGGEISVESVFGVGSKFEVRIPVGEISERDLVDGFQRNVVEAALEGNDGELHGRVLLVEDTVVNQKLFERMLTKLGLEVEIAENGKIGFEMAQSGDFELILMDMQMPVMDGYTATELLRQENYQAPIVGCTADASSSGKTRCLKVGCDDVLVKPFSTKKLVEVLHANMKASS